MARRPPLRGTLTRASALAVLALSASAAVSGVRPAPALAGSTDSAALGGAAVPAVPQASQLPQAALAAPREGWQWPLPPPPTVVRGFEPPPQRWLPGHRGVDLLGRDGQIVGAAGSGRVSFAGLVAGRPVVVVTHGQLRTTYEPVRATVRVGDVVAAGAAVGRLERGPSHCRPRSCLHWGLLRGRDYLDPRALVRRGPPRLLPVWAYPVGGQGAAGRSGQAHSPGPPARAAEPPASAAAPTRHTVSHTQQYGWVAGAAGGAVTLLIGWAGRSTAHRRRLM